MCSVNRFQFKSDSNLSLSVPIVCNDCFYDRVSEAILLLLLLLRGEWRTDCDQWRGGGGVGNMAVISTHQIPIVILLRYLYYELSQLKLYFFWYNYSIIKKGWNLNFQWFTYRYLCDILAISKYILIFILRIKQTI